MGGGHATGRLVAHRRRERTTRSGGAARAVATSLGDAYQTPLIPLVEPILAQGLDLAHQTLGAAAYAQAWAEGQAMSLDAAIGEARAVEIAPVASVATTGSHSKYTVFGNLTATELQVLRLLVDGNTTRQIAAELVVAVSTIDRHLTHIYTKLGARNRAEATAIALKHGLV